MDSGHDEQVPAVGESALRPSVTGQEQRRARWPSLRVQGVRHVLVAQGFSDLGDGISYVALAWLTLELTGSSLALGGVLAAQAVPRAAFTLLGGATSDRVSARLQMIMSALGRCAVMVTLAILTLFHRGDIWALYVLAAVFGIVDAFFQPARISLLPRVVEENQLESANSALGAVSRTCQIAGPALGAHWWRHLVRDPRSWPTLFASSVSRWCLLVCGSPARPPAETGQAGSGSLLTQIKDGLRYTFADPRLRAILAIDAAVTFAYAGPLSVGLASLVRFRFEQNAAAFGILDAALALGGLAGAVAGGATRLRPANGLLIAGLAAWLACGTAALGVAPELAAAATIAFLMGSAIGFQAVFGVSWVQRTIDREILGRVMSVDMVAGYALTPVSLVVTGALARNHLELLYFGTALLLAATAVGVLSSTTVRTMT